MVMNSNVKQFVYSGIFCFNLHMLIDNSKKMTFVVLLLISNYVLSAPANNQCANASTLACATSNLAGTTVSTASYAHGTGASISNYGVWYKFTGDGYSTTITSVASGGFDQQMTIVSGTCGSFTLVDDQDAGLSNGTETSTFTTVNGTSYYVYIAYWSSGGISTDTGPFTISRTCATPLNITWTGGTSTNWNTASNWSTSSVPTSNDNVTIPSGTTYSPAIGSTITAVCSNLTINASATLTIGNTSAGGGSFSIYGNLTNNGNIYHTSDLNTNLYGTSNTFGGSGNFAYNNEFVSFTLKTSANYTLSSNVTMLNQFRMNTGSSLSLSTYTISIYTFSFDAGTLNLNSGTLEIGNAINYTTGTLNVNTGTVYFNRGATVWTDYGYSAANQTINSFTYYNLMVRTNNGYTATIGDGSTVIVNNDFTILNPSTAGGTASTSYDVTVGNNFYLGNSGNALNLNMSNRIYRASGTGTFTMGNVSGHIINISYADATNYAISGFTTPTFYGTIIYNSASSQKIITATSYENLTCSGAGTKTLYAALDVNGILTLNAGSFDVGSNYAVTLGGDFVRASGATFNAQSGTITFDGSSTQVINVTSAGGTTPTNSDITFYNVVVANSDCRFYCDKTNSRKFNMTDFTINSSKKCSFYSN